MQVHFVYVWVCLWGCVRWNREAEINTLSSMWLIAERTPS